MKNYINTFEGFLNESKYKGNISGDSAEYIAKEMSQYVKGIIKQPNDNVTYFHLKDKSGKSKVIKTLLDVYGLEAVDGGNQFSPSPTIKFDNDQLLESLRSGPNDAKIYPIKKGSDPEDLLSGRSRGSWVSSKTINDILDVFGKEMTIYKGDEITEFLQVNSRDNSDIYKIVRRDLRGPRTVGYIPSYYQNFDQTEEINNTR